MNYEDYRHCIYSRVKHCKALTDFELVSDLEYIEREINMVLSNIERLFTTGYTIDDAVDWLMTFEELDPCRAEDDALAARARIELKYK
jgi:hypothetical protein